MNTDERIRRHLEASTASLRAPDRLDAVMAEGRRRNLATRTASVLGAAALLAAVVAIVGALQPDKVVPPVATTPSPTTDSALGAVVAGVDGIRILDTSGTAVRTLTSPEPYSPIAVAFPDARGGLVYQHETTPMEWEPGSILHLPAGAQSPSELVAPPDGGRLIPVGTGQTERGAYLYYLADSTGDTELRALSLDSGETTTLTVLEDQDVTAGGGIVALVDRSDMSCVSVSFLDVGGNPVESPLTEDCLPLGTGVAVSGDGRTAAFLESGSLVVREMTTGEVRLEQEIPDAYMVTGGPGGWAVRTPSETLLITSDGRHPLPPVEQGSVVPYARELEIPEGATLGPATGEARLPCEPVEAELSQQDLPPAVAETRRELFEAATRCDYRRLADLVEADATTFTFGGGTDPVEAWVSDGRHGDDPVTVLASLLNMRPAHDADSGLWAWPAAHVAPDDDDSWEEAGQLHDPEMLATMRESGTGYGGYRVGIGDDGRWMFFVAGD